ncbi:MAG: hypothetical protein A2Y81_02610 [Nitrospirae bacterium RBG_13_43_8]|nr:MAG: hypothetical protein A2Y81_02610 [Nitrospirae bacterium RBG_13_43_8]
MEKQDAAIREVRELAKRFTPEEIESCIKQHLEEGTNICEVKGAIEKVIGELAKAQFVKELMGKGMSFTDAIRDLARRIRLVQKGFKEE